MMFVSLFFIFYIQVYYLTDLPLFHEGAFTVYWIYWREHGLESRKIYDDICHIYSEYTGINRSINQSINQYHQS